MTTPAQAAPVPAAHLEEWFDREVRPVLLGGLAEMDRRSADLHDNTFRAIRHWLTELPTRAAQQGPETHEFARAMAAELRGLLGDA